MIVISCLKMADYELKVKDNALQLVTYNIGMRKKLTIKYEDRELREVKIRDGYQVYRMVYERYKKTPTHILDGKNIDGKHPKKLYYQEIDNELYYFGVNLTGYVDERDGLTYYCYYETPYMVKDNGIIRFIDDLRYHMFVIDAYPHNLIPDMPYDEHFHRVWLDLMRALYPYLYVLEGVPLKYFQHVFGNITSVVLNENHSIYKYMLHDNRGNVILKRITRIVDTTSFMDYVVGDKVVMQKMKTINNIYFYPLIDGRLNTLDHYSIIDYRQGVTFIRNPYDYYYVTGDPSISELPYNRLYKDPIYNTSIGIPTYYLDFNAGLVPWDIDNYMKIQDIKL